MIKVKTRDFGEVERSENDVIDFVQPPFGFEDCRRFTLLQDEEVGDQIAWLQSLDRAEVCFILFDPSGLSPFFQPQFPPQALRALGEGELHCWVIGVIPADFKETTVNLKSPILINPTTRKGAQIMLDQAYQVRHRLMEKEG